jgi:tRNA-specific 2-thiouridylase
MKKCVVVGMSGGVDSSVSAALLKKAGYHVIGLFMKNWQDDGVCTAEEDFHDIARVCDVLDIPYYAIDFSKEYYDSVFQGFLQDYQNGLTPNPDVLCNQKIKFYTFYNHALSLGADYFATGHYANVSNSKLFCATDTQKDQTYFLYLLTKTILSHVLFPIGGLLKSDVRNIARELGLPVSEKKDSTGICFIGERKFKDFLKGYIAVKPGPVVDLEGNVIGAHDGVSFYTIGQRKGFNIKHHKGGALHEPCFIVQKLPLTNTLVVAQGNNHPALFSTNLVAHNGHWIQGEIPSGPFHATAKIRYRQKAEPCLVTIQNSRLDVVFDHPQRAVTPGQSIVFYQGNECIGGAIITR